VPAEFWTETARMATSGAIVAAVAVPVGLVAWVFARRRREPLLPRWKPWRVPWGGFEVVAAFVVVMVFIPSMTRLGLSASGFYQWVYGPEFPGPPTAPPPSMEASAAVAGVPAAAVAHDELETAAELRELWSRTLALPVQLGLLALACRSLYPAWKPPPAPGLGSRVALAIGAWAVLTPVVLAVNAGVNALFTLFDVTPDAHPLTKLAGRPALDSAVLLFQASVAAPLVEEVLFRGVILAWAVSCLKPWPAPDVPAKLRPWLVASVGVLLAAMTRQTGPVVFALLLVGGLAVVVRAFRSKRRTLSAVYATAALFALLHSPIWPSPIPLFLLGLGLGWLAVRTRGVLVPVIVHGLFNAVSAVFVLRSAT
jgi:membrane protease YdiL (CAAX protease family)